MGGFLSAAARAIGGFTRDVGESAYTAIRGSKTFSGAMDAFFSQRREFMLDTPGDVGKKLLDVGDEFTMLRNQHLTPYNNALEGLTNTLKDRPDLMSQTLNQIDAALPATHPAKTYTNQLLNLSNFGNLTPKNISHAAGYEAAALAKLQVGQRNMSRIVDLVEPLYQSPDPVMHTRADVLLDIMANQFRDTQWRKGVQVSGTKWTIRRELIKRETAAVKAGGSPFAYSPKMMKVGAVYEGTSNLERWAARRARFFLAPFIAIPHMATFMNYSWAPLTAIGRTLATLTDRQIQQQMEASGIFNALIHSMVDEDIRTAVDFPGKYVSKASPTAARLIQRTIHAPGFNYLRKAQLWTGGILGYHSAQYWAEEALRGDERAIQELKELKIDTNDLISKQRKLTPQELQGAIWHFVNNRVFIDRAMDRAKLATSNPWFRMFTFFHGYVMNQQAFMRREFQKMLDAGDYKGIARFAGTVGLAFPAIAPAIHSLETMARMGSVKAGEKTYHEDWRELKHPKNASQFLGEYLSLLSFFGTWGVIHSYLVAAKNDRMALQALGPVYGSAFRMSQDAIRYALFPTKGGKRNIRPLAKDVLQQTVPGYGNIIANKLFPAAKKGRRYE